jgi:hypothetical protein
MTLDLYGHLFSDDLTNVAKALDAAAKDCGTGTRTLTPTLPQCVTVRARQRAVFVLIRPVCVCR